MALVTLQRSPSPSNDPDEETAEGGDEGLDGRGVLRHKRSKSTLQKLRKIFSTVRFISKLRPCLSESYFTVKGAALILPHSEINRKTSRKNHGGEIQRHLQAMLYLLRPEDKIKVAIRLENQRDSEHRYMALVSTVGRQDTEECVILGLDCTAPPCPSQTAAPTTPPSSPVLPDSHSHGATAGGEIEGRAVASASIGLVLPIWMGMKVRLSGDGGFSIITDEHSYLFKPVSVQAMWSAIQSVDKALHSANQMKYLAEGLTHTWVEYYRCKVDTSNQSRLATWNLMEDVEIFAPASLKLTNENETEKLKLLISAKLKEVMMSVDLDDATSRSLRQLVEEALNMKLDEFRNYFDEEMMRILGQMDAPSQILDFLYLGSEWNASNLDELQKIGIKYILNVTREIDNFFTGMFHYCNVRIYDYEDTELMKHWLKTYKFINKARKHDAKVLVHCKMGVSRSASTVIAFLMKENRWTLEKALAFVKERRSCVRPNKGFMEQLHTYEGILTASSKRDIFRSKSEHDIAGSMESGEGEEEGGSQQETILGESVFRMITGGEWTSASLTVQEEILLQKDFSGEHGYTGMEPDLETDSRSADSMEESLPDIPSPLNKEAPVQSVAFSVQDSKGSAGPPTVYSSSSPPRMADLGLISRIKPDTSWIKLAVGGESSTDNPNQEGMEVGESRVEEGRDTYDIQTARPQSLGSPEPPVIFIMGSEWDPDTSVRTGTDVGESSQLSLACGAGDQAPSSVRDLGVHHYYSREQIPWHPGKVRNIREELCKSGGQAGLTPSSGDLARPSAIESEKTLLEAVGNVKEVHPVPQSESCVELSALDMGATGMEIDDLSRSVYDLEDIPLVPGTVQRTRLEIEQRQKLYGEDSDQGISSIKRSASLREKREGSRSRHSQRRKTCTPIISPPPEKVADAMDVDMGTPVLRMDFEVGESTTDGVPMDLNRMEDFCCQGSKKVPVYHYYADCVPIKLGIVQRHKREIESKAEEGKHQQSLSVGSTSSGCSVEEMEALSLPTVPPDSKNLSQIPQQGLVHANYIPPAKSPWCPAGLGKKADSIDRKMDKDSEDCLGWGAKDCARKLDGEPVTPCQQSAACVRSVCVETSVLSGNKMDSLKSTKETSRIDPSLFRAAATSPRKPYGKSNIDAETLAMIREIGSAFVTSPPRGEEEDVGESTSLVKHLVKKIEKDSRHGRPERKIVLVDSSSKQDRPDFRRHSQMERPHSSLFTPSPEFTASMAKHLEGRKHVIPSTGHSAVLQGSTEFVSRNIAVTTADSRNVATAMLVASGRSGGGDRSHSEPPSVVKHLCGKFESQGAISYCDDGLSTEISCGFPTEHSLPATITMSGNESHFVSASLQDRGDSGYNSCCTPGWPFKSSSIEEPACSLPTCNAGGSDASPNSQNSRQMHSLEPVSLVISSWPRHSSTSRIRSPFKRDVGQSVEEVEEGFEAAKLRHLQNRKQLITRHRCPEQGERACPPVVCPSPFSSSM